jgi:membrane-associated phospholipid phosphatase
MKLGLFIVISAITISCSNGSAQQVKSSDSLNYTSSQTESRGPLSRIGGDLFTQLTAVFHMSKESSMWIGAGVLITGALIASDQATYNTIRRTKQNNGWMRKVSPYISNFGSWYGVSVIGAFTGFGLLFHNQKALETSYLAAESFLTSGLWVRGLKMLAGRERPSAENIYSHESGGEWWGPLVEFNRKRNGGRSVSSFDAFPSGHTASAFSIATVFANQYSSTLVVPIISYSLASLVGIARIIDDTHWASDVFVGAVIGYLTSKEVMFNNPSERSRREMNKNAAENKKSIRDRFSWSIDPFQKTVNIAYHL